MLGGNSFVDLSGRAGSFFGVVKYGRGGDLAMRSAHGDIVQNAGGVIDVSASNNNAGTLTLAADYVAQGRIALNGTLRGGATSSGGRGYLDGQVSLRAQKLGDFAALNRKLDDTRFFGARNCDLKQGDLAIGDEVKASTISILVDASSLTVNDIIDASGERPGTIRMAARHNLALASSAVLNTRARLSLTDSYGDPVIADNTSRVELTTGSVSMCCSRARPSICGHRMAW